MYLIDKREKNSEVREKQLVSEGENFRSEHSHGDSPRIALFRGAGGCKQTTAQVVRNYADVKCCSASN